MERGEAVLPDCRKMPGCSVSFMLLESVGMCFCVPEHQPVTGDFGENGSGRNAGFCFVSTDDCAVRIVEPEPVSPIYEEVGGHH